MIEEVKTYRVLIEAEGGGSESQKPRSTAQTDGGNVKTERKEGKAIVSKMAVAGFALGVVDTVASRYTQTVDIRTGNTTYQQKVNFVQSSAKKLASFGLSVAMGSAIAGLPGAIVGGVMNATMTALNYSNEINRFNIQRELEAYSISAQNIRAGALGNRGGAR